MEVWPWCECWCTAAPALPLLECSAEFAWAQLTAQIKPQPLAGIRASDTINAITRRITKKY